MAAFEMRERLVTLLEGHGAHISFDDAIEAFPEELVASRIPQLAHTAWQLVYHLWIVQHDILLFTQGIDYEAPSYPSGFWPEEDGPTAMSTWNETIEAFRTDLETMKREVADDSNDLFEPFPHGGGHNLFHEAVTLGDHNSYHIGQLVDLRMLLGVPVRDW